MANNEPLRHAYFDCSFGTFDVAEWPDGHKSANLRIDKQYRELPPNATEQQQKDFSSFQQYGTLQVRASDIPNLIHVAALVNPQFKYRYE